MHSFETEIDAQACNVSYVIQLNGIIVSCIYWAYFLLTGVLVLIGYRVQVSLVPIGHRIKVGLEEGGSPRLQTVL